MFRRAIILYVAAIVLPAIALLWLGIESFERQKQALATLTAEKIASSVQERLRKSATIVLAGQQHPVAQFHFTIQQGEP